MNPQTAHRRSAVTQVVLTLCTSLTLAAAACAPTAATPTAAPTTVPKPAAQPASAQPTSGIAPAVGSAQPAASAVAAPAPTTAAAAAPLTRITLAWSELIGTQIELWYAAEKGVFRRNGIDIDLQLVNSTNAMTAMLSGQAQYAVQGGGAIIGAAAGGADVVALHDTWPAYPYVFMAEPNVKQISDLKGKKVGVSAVGSSSDIATRVGLRKVGIDPDKDVAIIAVGSLENRVAAMFTGAIQGAVSQPPDTLPLEDKGFRRLFDMSHLGLDTAFSMLVAQRSTTVEKKDVTQKMVDSLIEAASLSKKDRAGTIEVLKKYYKSTDDRAMAEVYDFYVPAISEYGYIKATGFQDSIDALKDKNPKIVDVNLDKLIDPSFIKDAEARAVAKR